VISLSLNDEWSVEALDDPALRARLGSIPALVPGSIHEALERAALIPDPLVGSNESVVQWVSGVTWKFGRDFVVTDLDHDELDLVFEGLDTFATIMLNGRAIGETRNQHRSYRFPVKSLLRRGLNRLEVTFAPALEMAAAEEQRQVRRPHLFEHPFNMARKSAANFGWDWGPSLITAAIWRPVRLEAWDRVRISSVRTAVLANSPSGRLSLDAQVDWATPTTGKGVTFEVEINERVSRFDLGPGQSSLSLEIDAGHVEKWWPRSHGDSPLYPLRVALVDDDSQVGTLHEWNANVGFRTVGIDSAPDEHGTPFNITVNGVRIAARGANWIPVDILSPSRPLHEYRAALQHAVEANINLIRVWGGGTYEADAFYEVCDELGLMVWQDFMFACAAYPEEEPFAGEVDAEAREAVTRLAPHPSVVLWCGNNENLWGRQVWGWSEELEDRTWGEGYYREMLPAIVAELAPGTPYIPGSPFSVTDPAANSTTDSVTHSWDVWNSLDYESYSDTTPRFVSEFGFQGAPSWRALEMSMGIEPLAFDSPAWQVHQKAENGFAKLTRSLEAHFTEPADMTLWHWASQLNQAHAVDYGISWFRSASPVNSGTIIWQLNDCWSGMSWALVDGIGNRKPAWHAVRRAYADVLLAFVPDDGRLAVRVTNDSPQALRGQLRVRRVDLEGAVLSSQVSTVDIPARSSGTSPLSSLAITPGDRRNELLIANFQGSEQEVESCFRYFAPDKDLLLPVSDYSVDLVEREGGYAVTIMANTFLKDVWVQADRLSDDASVSPGLVTLLPGESEQFFIRTSASLTSADLLRFPAICTANDIVTSIDWTMIAGAENRFAPETQGI
jgi:beta-mannosidase